MDKTKLSISGEQVLLFLTGFFGLSTLSTQIMSALHIPYLIELFFLPIVLYYAKKIKSEIIISAKIRLLFFLYLIILLLSIFIGIFETRDIINIITCIRPFIYLSLIAYFCAEKKHAFSLIKVYLVVSGVLFGELVNKILFMNSLASIDHINTFALAVFVIIPFILNDKIKIVFSVVFGFIMAVLTLYRREIVIFAVALLCGVLYGIITRKSLKKIVYIFGSTILGYVLLSNIEKILTWVIQFFKLDNTSSQALSATYRIIEKFKTFNTASDEVRFNTWNQIFIDFNERLFPRGPVGKAYGASYFGAYTDSTNVFLYDVFGSLLSWIICLFILYKAIRCVLRVALNKVTDPEVVLSALMVPVFLICMVADGTFLVHANISIIAGYAIHGWFVKMNTERMKKNEDTIYTE